MSKSRTMTTEEWRKVHDPHRTPGFDHAREDASHPSGEWVRLRCACGDAHTTNKSEAQEAPTLEQLIDAACSVDWLTVVLNQGPPCFRYEADTRRFCLRAQRWAGHTDREEFPEHRFVSLDALLEQVARKAATEDADVVRGILNRVVDFESEKAKRSRS